MFTPSSEGQGGGLRETVCSYAPFFGHHLGEYWVMKCGTGPGNAMSSFHICKKDETTFVILQWWCQWEDMTALDRGAKSPCSCFLVLSDLKNIYIYFNWRNCHWIRRVSNVKYNVICLLSEELRSETGLLLKPKDVSTVIRLSISLLADTESSFLVNQLLGWYC